MITIGRIWMALGRFFEATAKARVNSVLLGMEPEKLAKMGYSYELLRRGPSAWPWRELTQDSAIYPESANADGVKRPQRDPLPASSVPASNRARGANGHGCRRDAA